MKTYISSLLLLISLLSSCVEKNTFVFKKGNLGWNVIVNDKNGDNSIEIIDNKFIFPESRVIIVDLEEIKFNTSDTFVFDNEVFDPNNEDENVVKLCYYMGAENCYFNGKYLVTDTDVEFNSKFKEHNTLDYYFFKIGVTCEEDTRTLDEFWDETNKFILLNN